MEDGNHFSKIVFAAITIERLELELILCMQLREKVHVVAKRPRCNGYKCMYKKHTFEVYNKMQ